MALHEVKLSSRESTKTIGARAFTSPANKPAPSGSKAWRVSFYFKKERLFIRLGRMAKADAHTIDANIQALVRSRSAGNEPAPRIAEWLAEVEGTRLADKLVEAGL